MFLTEQDKLNDKNLSLLSTFFLQCVYDESTDITFLIFLFLSEGMRARSIYCLEKAIITSSKDVGRQQTLEEV